MVKVPFTSDPWQTFSCTLNGTEYGFAVNYNDRNGVWSFDLSLKSTEAVLQAGIPILLGCDMLAPYGLGIGRMFAVELAASPAWALAANWATIVPSAQVIDGSPWTQAADSAAVIPALQMTDADPFGAFNDDLGTRVVVIYLRPGEGVPA